jgi:D-glycerate 3-kinase
MAELSLIHYHPLLVKFPELAPYLIKQQEDYRTRFSDIAGPAGTAAMFDLVFRLSVGVAEKNIKKLAISGAQGSGKSTFAKLLAIVLQECFTTKVATLSLDDFYLTRQEREQLAQDVHPLLSVRGVPGTHDLALLEKTLAALQQGDSIQAPVFDKAIDDRDKYWRTIDPSSVLLCEGWCWSARAEPAVRLVRACNELEKISDKEGRWRQFVNDSLTGYQSVFSSDATVYLKVPAMQSVYEWRWQQERELIELRGEAGQTMTRQEIVVFISHYERLTRWMIEDMPSTADVCVYLNNDHGIADVAYREDA